MIFGIGVGSTELVLLEKGEGIPRILDWQSVPWGVVSLPDTVGGWEDTPDGRTERYRRMRQRVTDSFAPFAQRIAGSRALGALRLLGTSGSSEEHTSELQSLMRLSYALIRWT